MPPEPLGCVDFLCGCFPVGLAFPPPSKILMISEAIGPGFFDGVEAECVGRLGGGGGGGAGCVGLGAGFIDPVPGKVIGDGTGDAAVEA